MAVRADLATLRAALDSSPIPPKSLDRNLLIATWNVRGFGRVLPKWESAAGDSPRRNLRDMLCLAEIVSRFDVVALQDVKRDLGGLRLLMEGPKRKVIGDSPAQFDVRQRPLEQRPEVEIAAEVLVAQRWLLGSTDLTRRPQQTSQ